MSETRPPPARVPTQIAAAETPSLSTLLTLAVFVVIVAGLYLGREVLIPIALAGVLSFILAPLANLFRHIGLGRVLSVLLAVTIALGVVVSLGGLIGKQIADLAQDAPLYQSTIQRKTELIREYSVGRISAVVSRWGRQVEPPKSPAAPAANSSPPHPAETESKPIPVEVHQPDPTPLQLAERILLPVVSPLTTVAIVFIVAVFVLLQREDLRGRLIRLFGSGDLHRTTQAMNDATERLSRYFLTQLAVNAAFGLIIGTGLFVIGVPSPVLWGVFGALLRFVPYIGAPLSAALPMLLAAAVDPGWTMLLWTAGLFFVVELLTGQAIEPMLYGHSTGLSPISVIVAATFWTWLWGPIGLILSTPLTLCLVVMGRHIDRLEFLDVLLGDRPALTPVENFYQRMLAGDPDEAQDQAERLLKECSLSAYYDEVAIKGLQLAANDVERGVLGAYQLERVKESIEALVEDLGVHDDLDPQARKEAKKEAKEAAKQAKLDEAEEAKKEVASETVGVAAEGVAAGAVAAAGVAPLPAEAPAPAEPSAPDAPPVRDHLPSGWRDERPVMCIAGRGPLDDAATMILAQLLEKHGLPARIVTHEAVSRANVGMLDAQGVAMVCITYLEIGGTPSHLRYLLRRLRQRLPNIPILVAVWPPEDPVLKDERLRDTIGVEYYATSVREAVQACLEALHKAAEEPQETARAA